MKIKINSMKFTRSDNTTVCTIKSEYIMDNISVNLRGLRSLIKCFNKKEIGYYNFKFTVIARTTCKSPDKFDKLIGERIAESKAKIKLGKKLKKINNILKDSLKTSEYILALNNTKFDKFIAVEEKHIKDLDPDD